jgi:DNA-binding transcriptional LysR family regulator
MDRLRRVNRLWNWLPAFRAVAETEHLPSASELLGVSPSALSRTIKLVEEDVGRPLFDREGRQLRLNANGHAFLRAVRDAMRRVHDGLGEIGGGSLDGRVRIAMTGPARLLFAPALLDGLRDRHPRLEPALVSVAVGEETPALLRGEIDVAFTHVAVEHDNTEVERIGQLRTGVFCGPGHELHERPGPTRAQILEHGFASVSDERSPHRLDAWPAGVDRQIGVRVPSLEMALRLCLRGDHLAALPELIAHEHPQLRRLPLGGLPSVPVFSCRREQLSAPAKAEACIALMRRVLSEAN